MCYGEQPTADLLLESINGSLIAVVVLDDMAAIPGWDSPHDEDVDQMDEDDFSKVNIDGDNIDQETPELQRPLIVRTPTSDLPYFNPLNNISLSPAHSHCIGLALARGVDMSKLLLPSHVKFIHTVTDAYHRAQTTSSHHSHFTRHNRRNQQAGKAHCARQWKIRYAR